MRRLASFALAVMFVGCASAAPRSDLSNGDEEAGAGGEASGGGAVGGRVGGTAGNAEKAGAAGSVGNKAGAAGSPSGAGGAEAGAGGGNAAGAGGESGQAGTGGSGGEAAGGSAAAGKSGVAGGAGKGGAAGAAGKGAAAGSAGKAGGATCVGVVCVVPPAKHCLNDKELEVFSPQGTCSAGQCSYAATKSVCTKGCANDACIDDPCFGVTCSSPPASKCGSATDLDAYEVPGTCNGGTCSYKERQIYCAFGCVSDSCKNDPCAGKSCQAPPASYCSGPDRLTVADAEGVCDPQTTACTYKNHVETCAFGCIDGSCAGDPCQGKSCGSPPAAYCFDANTRRAAAPAGICADGVCSYVTTDESCANGCVNGICRECAGDGDCGANKICDVGVCQVCATDARCGTACTACGGGTPFCKAGGATSACVECTASSQCTGGKICGPAGTCIDDGCPPPADACTNGPVSQSREKCGDARIIGRAAAASGYSATGSTCSADDDSNDSGGCFDAGRDHFYRLYMRAGDVVQATIITGKDCMGGSQWAPTLKIYAAATCTGNTLPPFSGCGTRLFCEDYYRSKTGSYTAASDGWVAVVVDGSFSGEDNGDYQFNVKLICKRPGCECP